MGKESVVKGKYGYVRDSLVIAISSLDKAEVYNTLKTAKRVARNLNADVNWAKHGPFNAFVKSIIEPKKNGGNKYV